MAEQYSVQAENLIEKSSVEEYTETLKDVKATDANITILRNIRISISGKPRRLVDVSDLRTTEDPHLIELLVFNTEHIELLTEKINEVEFDYQVDGQFIRINVPDPSYKQLMEVVDDLNRKNHAMSRLTKPNQKQQQELEQPLKMNLLHKALQVQHLENVMNTIKNMVMKFLR